MLYKKIQLSTFSLLNTNYSILTTKFYILLSLLSILTSHYSILSSQNNPYYWKNKKPYEGYWQQDVQYKIKADLNDKTSIVDGNEELTYQNNSPDELSFVYFHLYSNAQVKDSYLSDLYKNNGFNLKYGKYQEQKKGTEVTKISIDGIDLKTELDNTILKVWLPKPLKPNEAITFNIDFKTYFDNGTIRNRMKSFNSSGYKHFDLVHWYPRISVYDRKFGWDTEQHMDHEFYGDYGIFDVEISFANNYIVDATGVLQNQEEALPADLRQKLDLKNFKDKPWGSAPSEIIKRDSTKKTWKYHAENVHDFALTADPTYRIGEAEWNGIKCIALVQEPHAAKWQNAAEYAAKVIQINSEDFGMYAYPKMIVADAQDGMEYPMLTLDGGQDPDYRSLLVHEISHNWFFGMIGNNETYRPMLDEGFTQFLTAWTCDKIDGKFNIKSPSKSKYVQKHTRPDPIMNSRVYNGYIFDASKNSETIISTHSDGFNGATGQGGGYGQVYYKTSTMLYNLQYVLGDSLFLKAMQHYVSQWKMCHPYVEDFRNSIIQFTKVDLNWFFDQWIETAKTIDYSVNCVKKGKEKDEYIIDIERKGKMQMPIDFEVIGKDNTKHEFYIPNNWFEKKTNATTLPRWIGWDKTKPTYQAHVTIPSGISDVMIDPTHRLADVNMLNNSKKTPVKFYFDSRINNTASWTNYEVFLRPDVWYNGYDGVKIGLNMNGNYMNYFHVFDATVWYNTGLLQSNLPAEADAKAHDLISFRVNYTTATDKFIKKSSVNLSAKVLDGLNSYVAGFEKRTTSEKNRFYVFFKSMYRANKNDLNYLLYPTEWEVAKYNNTLNIGMDHNYRYYRGTGKINLAIKSSSIASDYDYSILQLSAINKNTLGKIKINTRVFMQYGSGSQIASESALYLSGANSEELMENKYTRSQGFFSPSMAGFGATTNNFQAGGGLNLRGYAGYLAPQLDAKGSIVYAYKGNSGAAFNTEIEFGDLLKLNKSFIKNTFKLTPYLFADAGTVNYNAPSQKLLLADLRADAGIGTTLTINKFGSLQKINPLVIRLDVPFFLSSIPATDKDYLQFRWVIGVNRSF